jgi:2-isopropylmalate synthase
MPLRTVYFGDTTLRDGEQMPGASLTGPQKVQIARALAEIGVVSLDGGFPAAAQSEIDSLQLIVREVPHIPVSALCRTLRSDIDQAREALAFAPRARAAVSLFVGTSPLHREHKLRRTVAEIVGLVRDSIEYARLHFDLVGFSAEDASRTEPDILIEIYREAIDAGARFIGFPDTVGVLTPHGVRRFIRKILDDLPNIGKAMLAGHFHNDLGLATANTLAALEEGVPVVQCTVNGIGERAGNTAFEEVVMAIALNGEEMGLRTDIDTSKLWSLSRLVSTLTGIGCAANKPVVGSNVFLTEAGIHQDGLLKHPDTYLPFRPERVGAPGFTCVLGKHSGRAAFGARLAEMGFQLDREQLDRVIGIAKSAPKEAWGNEAAVLSSAVAAVLARESNTCTAGG